MVITGISTIVFGAGFNLPFIVAPSLLYAVRETRYFSHTWRFSPRQIFLSGLRVLLIEQQKEITTSVVQVAFCTCTSIMFSLSGKVRRYYRVLFREWMHVRQRRDHAKRVLLSLLHFQYSGQSRSRQTAGCFCIAG